MKKMFGGLMAITLTVLLSACTQPTTQKSKPSVKTVYKTVDTQDYSLERITSGKYLGDYFLSIEAGAADVKVNVWLDGKHYTKRTDQDYQTSFDLPANLNKKTIATIRSIRKTKHKRIITTGKIAIPMKDLTAAKGSSSSSSVNNAQKYQNKLQSLNTGEAEDVNFDEASKTVTWKGYDDWLNWSHSDLQRLMNIFQTISYKWSTHYGYQNINIVVTAENGTVIAQTKEGDPDLQFVR